MNADTCLFYFMVLQKLSQFRSSNKKKIYIYTFGYTYVKYSYSMHMCLNMNVQFSEPIRAFVHCTVPTDLALNMPLYDYKNNLVNVFFIVGGRVCVSKEDELLHPHFPVSDT